MSSSCLFCMNRPPSGSMCAQVPKGISVMPLQCALTNSPRASPFLCSWFLCHLAIQMQQHDGPAGQEAVPNPADCAGVCGSFAMGVIAYIGSAVSKTATSQCSMYGVWQRTLIGMVPPKPHALPIRMRVMPLSLMHDVAVSGNV